MARFVLVFFSLLFASSAFSQLLSYGIKGGVALTDAFYDHDQLSAIGSIHTFSNSKDYVIGPMVEVHLPFGLDVEADALFRPYYLDFQSIAFSNTTNGSTAIHAWEFPILIKYKLPSPILKPYIAAGPSFRATGSSGDGLSSKGFTIGGGVDVKALVLHVSPELRYTFWPQGNQVDVAAAPAFSKQNQVELLVGVTF